MNFTDARCLFFGLILAAAMLAADAAVVRVHPDGNDTFAGDSWMAARRTVSGGLSAAKSGDELWVAGGVYPEHIQLKDGVALFGGFAGSETSRQARDWSRSRSVLDGTTNGIVVMMVRCGSATALDGFVVQDGSGTGIRCVESAGAIRNNLIRGNVGNDSLAYGGAISVSGESADGPLIIEDNRIVDNANFDGGGIACIDASPRIEGNWIAWNLAYQNGGGISCWRNSSPVVANNVLVGNTCSWLLDSPVPIGGGGIFATADDLDGRPHPTATCSPVIRNNVVAANGGKRGGGLALIDCNGGVPVLVNNTLVANNGAGLSWGSSSLPLVGTKPIIRNNLVAYNTWGLEQADGTPFNPHIERNCVFGNQVQGTATDYSGLVSRTGTNGNIAVDPLLANHPFGNFHLQPTSPCRDAGLTSDEMREGRDMDGQPRVQGAAVDIGADESDGRLIVVTNVVFHVRPSGDDASDGRTWSTARRTVQSAIESAKLVGAQVWVASGTYTEHVVLPAFVYLYGGFAGTETELGQRKVAANPTVLDGAGEIKVVQCGNGGYLVSTLDGFTVQNGGKYTGGAGLTPYGVGGLGGGLYIGVSSPMIRSNLITHNSLAKDNRPTLPQPSSYGAGIYCELSYARILGNTLRENEVLNTFDGSGGAIYCTDSMLTIEDNAIVWNHAPYGAAICAVHSSIWVRHNLIQSNAFYNTYPLPLYLGSGQGAITFTLGKEVVIEGNRIEGNTAAIGGGMHLTSFESGRIENNLVLANRAWEPTGIGGTGGGLYCIVTTNTLHGLVVANNTFVSNSAATPFGEQGGAIAFTLLPPADQLILVNNLIASNSSGIFRTATTPLATPVLLNNNLWHNASNYVYLAPGTNDLSVEPAFRDPAHGDFRLQSWSPCIDAGAVTWAPATDFDGIPRPLDGNNDGGPRPDVGAFEAIASMADSDSDGMPDGWELANGLDPVANDASQDPDQDGLCNRDEYFCGTLANDAHSSVRVQADFDKRPMELTLQWESAIGRLYRLDYLQGLNSVHGWQVLEDNLAGTGQRMLRVVPVGRNDCFFRLVIFSP